MIRCVNNSKCSYWKSEKCADCSYNTMRNFKESHYLKAEDKPIPENCPKLHYVGPAEQTLGYECPVCGGYTNPYVVEGKRCKHCGYELNI